jgi:DNA-binding transcriptional LysR family regulator
MAGLVLVLLQRHAIAIKDFLGIAGKVYFQFLVLHAMADEGGNALKRLRLLLGDELFQRTSKGMEPTPYANQLAEPIAYALSTIHSSLNNKHSFDPLTSNRRFTLGVTDIEEIYFLPRLMDLLAKVAPHVTVSSVRNTAVNLRDEMEAGHVDLAIGLLPQLKAGFFQRSLFHRRYVCMFRAGHALDKEDMTVKPIASARRFLPTRWVIDFKSAAAASTARACPGANSSSIRIPFKY